MLSSDCIPQQQFKGGISVVDPKSPDFQRALPNSVSDLFDNKDRNIQERLGCRLLGKALITYHKQIKITALHFEIDSTTDLSYKCLIL